MDDPDAIWKPGYDGPPPVIEAVPEPVDQRPSGGVDGDEPTPPRRPRRRWVGVAAVVAVALAVGVAVAVLDRLDAGEEPDRAAAGQDASAIEPPDDSVFGGPEARRLPLGATTLWSVDVAGGDDHWVDVVGRDLVIAAVAEPVPTLLAFDALTGAQRWTAPLTAAPGDVTLVGAVDGMIVLEQRSAIGPTVTGVDTTTGVTRWTSDPGPDAGHVGLVGTPFVARLPSPSDPTVHLIDAMSGRDVGSIVGDPTAPGRPGGWFTDRRGTWYVVDDGEVVAHDLSTELGDGSTVGPVDVTVDDVSVLPVVVDERVAVVDGTGSFALVGSDAPPTVSADVPSPVSSLMPVSDSNVVLTSPGSIAGLSVVGESVEVAWSRSEGALADEHPVEGGTLLQVATRGGGAMELVDGRSGETVEQLTMVAGALQALVVAGDGYVALRSADLGTRLAGVGLDGSERWSILGPEPVVVGDRVVVRATSPGGQLRITTYGDID